MQSLKKEEVRRLIINSEEVDKSYWEEFQQKYEPIFMLEDTPIIEHNWLFSREETEQLIGKANQAFSTESNEILLAALSLTVKEVFDKKQFVVEIIEDDKEIYVENYGNTQTNEKYSYQYPIELTIDDYPNLSRPIKLIKEQVRSVPNQGWNYQWLQNYHLKPQIGFAYVPSNETDVDIHTRLKLADKNPKHYAIYLNISMNDNCLNVTFMFRGIAHKQAYSFKENFTIILKNIIDFCTEQDTQELTSSDFGYSKFSVSELENFFN
jgi:tyrocidine synthetase-3